MDEESGSDNDELNSFQYDLESNGSDLESSNQMKTTHGKIWRTQLFQI